VDPTSSPETWIDTSHTPEAVALRVIVFIGILAVSGVVAVAVRDALGRARRDAGTVARGAMGRPMRPEWATGEWACGRCRTVNGARRDRCQRCRAPRLQVEMAFTADAREPDVIPIEVPAGPDALVMLEHRAEAHRADLAGHWRLRVNGVVAGSAASRDGALALLRALRGTETVLFDPKGLGYAPYPLASLIAAFEGPRLPFSGPCPEAGERRVATPPR
jgi:hypothetical protein